MSEKQKLLQYARKYSSKYGVPYDLVTAVMRAESGIRHSGVRSGAGAIGAMQLMPGTAQGLGVNPNDPEQNVKGGIKYLSQLLKQFEGNTRLAVAGYNAGGGAARKAITAYPETRNYVKRVMGYYGGGDSVPAGEVGSGGVNPPGPPTGGGMSDGQQWALNYFAKRTSSKGLRDTITQIANRPVEAAGGDAHDHGEGAGAAPNSGPLRSYKDLLRSGEEQGLVSQGSFQTTGGKHSPGSRHYKRKAVDWGDATNTEAKLRARARFLLAYERANPGVQIAELYYNPLGWGIKNGRYVKGLTVPGHDDHLHESVA